MIEEQRVQETLSGQWVADNYPVCVGAFGCPHGWEIEESGPRPDHYHICIMAECTYRGMARHGIAWQYERSWLVGWPRRVQEAPRSTARLERLRANFKRLRKPNTMSKSNPQKNNSHGQDQKLCKCIQQKCRTLFIYNQFLLAL